MQRLAMVVVVGGSLLVACAGGTGGSTGTTGTTSTLGSSSSTGSSGTTGNGQSLIGTWDLNTTPNSSTPTISTLVIGQDSLTITTSDTTFTAQRVGNTLTFQDNSMDNPGGASAQQTQGSFDTGVIPFNLGGTWTLTGGNSGQPTTVSCTGNVTATEIDGTCTDSSQYPQYQFQFTTSRGQTASSDYGDFGGIWNNTFTNQSSGNGSPTSCQLTISGPSITSCASGGSVLEGISVAFGGNTVSGSVQGSEFMATRQ